MTYDLLPAPDELERFTRTVIPDLDEDEALLLFLNARGKYLSETERRALSMPSTLVLRREVITRKDQIASVIAGLCARTGHYTDRAGHPIPEHALAVYLTPNPRSQRKAALATLKDLADSLYAGKPVRVVRTAVSNLHTSASRKTYLDLDIDLGDGDDLPDLLAQIRRALGSTTAPVVHTRGGAHVLVRTKTLDPSVKKTFYREVQAISRAMVGEIEIRSDTMVPVPGTRQGGTAVRLAE